MSNMQKGEVNYKVKAVKVSGDMTGKKKYIAVAVSKKTVDFDDFVTHIAAHHSPFSHGTIHGVLTDMLNCLQEIILNGESVRLGDLGIVSLGINGKSAESLEAWNQKQNVTGIHLLVRNTKAWSNTELRKRCRLVEAGTYVAGEGTGTKDDNQKTPSEDE